MELPKRSALLYAAVGGTAYIASRILRSFATPYRLDGRSVLITGGSRGLGLALAREFGSQGARVAILARDPEELDRAAADLTRRGVGVVTHPCDLTDRHQAERAIPELEQRLGGIDVLVNNAGQIQVGPYESMTVGDFDRAMAIHYFAPLYLTMAAWPGMRDRGGGRIVNISSIAGKVSMPHMLPYSASKFALVGLSEGLRSALKRYGIVVTTVCPGLMRTGSPHNAEFKGHHRAEYAWFSIGDSIPGLTISAEHAARAIVGACRRGDADLILSWPAEMADKLHSLFPGQTADLLAWMDRLLPGPGGIGQTSATGDESASSASPSPITTLTERAAVDLNQNPASA